MSPAAIRIVSLNTGMPKPMLAPDGTTWTSSIDRRPATGPVRLTEAGLAGDACAWSGHHGNSMALNVFPTELYPLFEEYAGRVLRRPSFGENLTLEGLPDKEARIGDVLRAGDVVLEVSQPREPCGNLVRYLGLPGIVKWMRDNLLSGYYLRVLQGGTLEPGQELELTERGEERWTIEALNEAMYRRLDDAELVAQLEALPALSPNWRKSLRKQHDKSIERNARKGASTP